MRSASMIIRALGMPDTAASFVIVIWIAIGVAKVEAAAAPEMSSEPPSAPAAVMVPELMSVCMPQRSLVFLGFGRLVDRGLGRRIRRWVREAGLRSPQAAGVQACSQLPITHIM